MIVNKMPQRPFWKLHISTIITIFILGSLFVWLNVRTTFIKQENGNVLLVQGPGWPISTEKSYKVSDLLEQSTEIVQNQDRISWLLNVMTCMAITFALVLNVELLNRRYVREIEDRHDKQSRHYKQSEHDMPLFWFVLIGIIVFTGETIERLLKKLRGGDRPNRNG